MFPTILVLCLTLLIPFAAAEAADETPLFTSFNLPPDALIVLDLSYSMRWNPIGDTVPLTQDNKWGADDTCVGPFYSGSGFGHEVDCSRVAIAKRAIFKMLDADSSKTINSQGSNTDDVNLNARFGYMRFKGCDYLSTDGSDYNALCNKVFHGIGTKYATIYCGNSSSCAETVSSCPTGTTCVAGESTDGNTPIAASLREAKLYLDWHKTQDTAGNANNCRKKFVILITDGDDTLACPPTNGNSNQADQYKRRRESVAAAKALKEAGYHVFVVGLGASMPDRLRNTLNWMAFYGGTDNAEDANSGDFNAYPIAQGDANLFPPGIVSCQAASTTPPVGTAPCNGSSPNCFADSYDPGKLPLSGYAYISSNGTELANALRAIVNTIQQGSYSFTVASISSARIVSENNIYEASFQPTDGEPFWAGHLRKLALDSNGNVLPCSPTNGCWDAGQVLANTVVTPTSGRNMKTCTTGCPSSLTDFQATALDPRYFNLANTNTARRDQIVNYFRGVETFGGVTYNEDNWKLGDIWHSSPVVIASPSPFYRDPIDTSVPSAFSLFRENNQRVSTSAAGTRIVVVGANDGQFHVFKAFNGVEAFSFVPPNLMPKMNLVAHASHAAPLTLTHQYFVDGPITAADVWLGSGSGTAKAESEWKTLAVVGLGRGVNVQGSTTSYLWGSLPSCAAFDGTTAGTFSSTYSAGTPHYCGYYAFDITSTFSPSYKWRINTDGYPNARYLGDPWSKMSIGKVLINGNERWVGFIGAGGFEYSCSGGQPSEPTYAGKGFFAVDLRTGDILWSFTNGAASSSTTSPDMQYSIPAPPAIVDTDNDGFVDTAYVADLGGNMWRFRFCNAGSSSSCGTSSWAGGLAYKQSSGQIRPVYTAAVLSRDSSGNTWLYWGSGDKQCPTDANAQERFYAMKDNPQTCASTSDCSNPNADSATCQAGRCSYRFTFNSFDNLTSLGQTYGGVKQGYSFNFSGSGEKMLSEPTVFNGVVFFTTFTPQASNVNVCATGGSASIYAVDFDSGAGTLSGGQRGQSLGQGIATGPTVSLRPDGSGVDLYVTLSGSGNVGEETKKVPINPNLPDNRSNIIYWRDRRAQ